MTQKEIEEYAKIMKFRGKKTRPYNPKLNKLLGELEENHPEIKFSTFKSFEAIEI